MHHAIKISAISYFEKSCCLNRWTDGIMDGDDHFETIVTWIDYKLKDKICVKRSLPVNTDALVLSLVLVSIVLNNVVMLSNRFHRIAYIYHFLTDEDIGSQHYLISVCLPSVEQRGHPLLCGGREYVFFFRYCIFENIWRVLWHTWAQILRQIFFPTRLICARHGTRIMRWCYTEFLFCYFIDKC